MIASFEGAVAWAHHHKVLVFAGTALLLALSLIGLGRITFDPNVLTLLPVGGEAVPAFRTYLERFGTLDDVYVVFTAPADRSIAEYEDEIGQWVEALREIPELTHIDSGIADGSRDWSWLLDRELLLLDERRLDEALNRLRPESMPAALAATRELLTIPSPDVAAMVQDDPLGFHELLRQQLGAAAGSSLVPGAASRAGYLSPDGRQRLVIARPSAPPYDTDFSHRLFDQLNAIRPAPDSPPDDAEPRPAPAVMFAGGHRIAIEVEALVKRESIVNGLGALALILPMLFLVFRSAWLVLIGALPSAVALFVVLGLMGLGGVTLSAAATGASAMLFGLGVDGVVLLYVAHRHALAEGRDPDAAVRALGRPAVSMLLGMWTTAATFLGLLVVDFPSLEQLGLLIGSSMIVCGVMTLLIVPASLPSKPPRGLPRSLVLPGLARWVERRRREVLVVATVATVVLAFFASTVRVNFTLDRLRSVTPGAHAMEDVSRAFELPTDVFVVLAEGARLQPLLASNERFVARLQEDAPGLAIQAPTAFLPSEHTQVERLRRIRTAVQDLETVRVALERAAAATGFQPHAFDRFVDRLPRLVAPENSLTWDGFTEHRLDDLIQRFVVETPDGWSIASYAFPATPAEAEALRSAVAASAGMVLTGLPVVNEEMSKGFMPQFLLGLAVGSAIVIASIVLTFRDLRLSLLTLVPTALGLTWAAGLLGLAQVELDLFSIFAVITFVGIGVDYGIHLVHRCRERREPSAAVAELAPVILVAGAITLFGYGTLITSSYPPLQSIGIVSAVSVVTLVIASVFVLPALLQRKR